jgi:hypothetical protein
MSGTQSNSIARVYDSLSGRNRVINGNMNVVQRATSVAAGAGNTYGGPDRFVCSNSNAVGAFTQGTGTITYNNVTRPAIVQTVGTSASSFTASQFWTGIVQIIEGFNAYDLVGQPITVSFIFNTNLTGTYTVCLTDTSQAHSIVQTFVATANTPNYYSITFPASNALNIPASNVAALAVTIGFISGTTFQTSTLGTWLTGNFQMASTATLWSASTSNFIAISELQVEHGNIATPFERESYGATLTKCQRYYFASSGGSNGDGAWFSGNVTSGGGYYGKAVFPVQMRVSPTVTITATAATDFPTTGAVVAGASPTGFMGLLTANATGAGSFAMAFTASAEY